MKILELRDGAAVAFAGNAELGYQIADFMRENSNVFGCVADTLRFVETSLGPFEPGCFVELLVIEGTSAGDSKITKWNTKGEFEDIAEAAWVGSLPSTYVDTIARCVLGLRSGDVSRDVMLCSGIALVQLLCHHNDLAKYGVGGVIYGLWVRRRVAIWNEDLITVFLGDDHIISGRVSTQIRDAVLCVNTTYNDNEGIVLAAKTKAADAESVMAEWWDKWGSQVHNYIDVHFKNCKHWIFINTGRELAVLYVMHCALNNVQHELVIEGAGPATFQMWGELKDAIFNPIKAGPTLRVLERIAKGLPKD